MPECRLLQVAGNHLNLSTQPFWAVTPHLPINNRISRKRKQTDIYCYLACLATTTGTNHICGTGRSRCIFINSTKTGRWKTPDGRRPDARSPDDEHDVDDAYFFRRLYTKHHRAAHLQMRQIVISMRCFVVFVCWSGQLKKVHRGNGKCDKGNVSNENCWDVDSFFLCIQSRERTNSMICFLHSFWIANRTPM